VIALLSFGWVLAAAANLTNSPAPDFVRTDSGKTVKYVRSAQAAFEAFRRARLPRGESHGGECDVRIGRFCYWRGDESEEDAPPEAPAIVARRLSLIHTLDSIAALLPGDGWIAGQRVRYLVEAERTDDALAAARDCRAEAWWCAALGGYAAHVGGRYDVADSLYESALAAMTSAQRCDWMDIRDLVADDLDRAFKNDDCAGRERLARRVFWLGAPLWSVSETDLLTEHLARRTRTRISERAASPDGVWWADDIQQLVMRYGWSRWFSRNDPAFGSTLDAQITGHDRGQPYYFLPTRRAIDEGPSAPLEWSLENPRATSGYSPSYARSLHEVDAQIATFRRGDSTLVVGAWDVRRDSTLVGRELNAALVIAGRDSVAAMSQASGERAVGQIQATSLVDTGWASLELLAREDRRAGRLRIGLVPHTDSGRVALSDLLLYAPSDAPVYDLAAARHTALGNRTVPFSRALGVFWETYGLAPQGESAQFELTVEQIEIGWLQRAAERLRFSDPTTATRVQWREVPRGTNGLVGRGVRIDLSRLRAGKYRLELKVKTDDGASATAMREIEVRDR
jgi:hypothetical protein